MVTRQLRPIVELGLRAGELRLHFGAVGSGWLTANSSTEEQQYETSDQERDSHYCLPPSVSSAPIQILRAMRGKRQIRESVRVIASKLLRLETRSNQAIAASSQCCIPDLTAAYNDPLSSSPDRRSVRADDRHIP